MFLIYFLKTIIHPKTSLENLVNDPKKLRYGFFSTLLIGILYTLVVTGLAIKKVSIVTEPWIAIPAESYYFWSIFFCIPLFLILWIISAALIQIFAHLFKGSGQFEQSLSIMGFSFAIPMFLTLVPEFIITIIILVSPMEMIQLRTAIVKNIFLNVFFIVYQPLALFCYCFFYSISSYVVHKLKIWQSIIVGIVTVIIVGFISIIFIR